MRTASASTRAAASLEAGAAPRGRLRHQREAAWALGLRQQAQLAGIDIRRLVVGVAVPRAGPAALGLLPALTERAAQAFLERALAVRRRAVPRGAVARSAP